MKPILQFLAKKKQSFTYGMSEGVTDIFVQPYLGAKEDGVVGAVKGFGKGTVALTTKTISGRKLYR